MKRNKHTSSQRTKDIIDTVKKTRRKTIRMRKKNKRNKKRSRFRLSEMKEMSASIYRRGFY